MNFIKILINLSLSIPNKNRVRIKIQYSVIIYAIQTMQACYNLLFQIFNTRNVGIRKTVLKYLVFQHIIDYSHINKNISFNNILT